MGDHSPFGPSTNWRSASRTTRSDIRDGRNASVLLEGSRMLPDRQRDTAIVYDVAHAGLRSYARDDQEWPCGAGAGTTPSLMLGLSGIGYYYLALSDRSLPSVVAISAADWSAAETTATDCGRRNPLPPSSVPSNPDRGR
jgi:hypothetical protein